MNIRQELLNLIDQLPDEKLAALLSMVLSLETEKHLFQPVAISQAYQDWLSPENDIYDKIFADELSAR